MKHMVVQRETINLQPRNINGKRNQDTSFSFLRAANQSQLDREFISVHSFLLPNLPSASCQKILLLLSLLSLVSFAAY